MTATSFSSPVIRFSQTEAYKEDISPEQIKNSSK